MNIIEISEKLKNGAKIRKENWNKDTYIAAIEEEGNYKVLSSGDLSQEILTLLSTNFEVIE